MPKKPVFVGELQFSSKGEARTYFSEILNKHPVGSGLSDSDFDDVMSLLMCHPKAAEKIGSGVKSIKINQGFYSANRCFHVVRTDGSVEDFSIGKCINGDHSAFHKFCIACRRAVESELRAMKGKYFEENGDSEHKVVCPITKEKIKFHEAHVDHREPFTFSSIVHFFIKANTININEVEYLTEGKYGNEFKDNFLTEKFRTWHRENAKLRVVKGKTNLSKSYLGRVTNTKADKTLT
jgi:hypothetical protein